MENLLLNDGLDLCCGIKCEQHLNLGVAVGKHDHKLNALALKIERTGLR